MISPFLAGSRVPLTQQLCAMRTCVGACTPVWGLAVHEAVQVVGRGGSAMPVSRITNLAYCTPEELSPP